MPLDVNGNWIPSIANPTNPNQPTIPPTPTVPPTDPPPTVPPTDPPPTPPPTPRQEGGRGQLRGNAPVRNVTGAPEWNFGPELNRLLESFRAAPPNRPGYWAGGEGGERNPGLYLRKILNSLWGNPEMSGLFENNAAGYGEQGRFKVGPELLQALLGSGGIQKEKRAGFIRNLLGMGQNTNQTTNKDGGGGGGGNGSTSASQGQHGNWDPFEDWFKDPSNPDNLPPGTDFFGENNFNDPYNVFLSAVPVMEMLRDQQISDSMAEAGFTGNRYSSSAERKAAEIGAETTLSMQNLLNQLLYAKSEADQNRALTAAGMGGTLGMNIDQLAQNRLGALGDFGTYEQDRMDDIMRMLFMDFRNNQYGLLPYMMGSASGAGVGIPYENITPGKGGLADFWELYQQWKETQG